MVKSRIIFSQKIKKEYLNEYLNYHKSVWPELEKVYKDHGVLNISCFINGYDLLVYYETNDDIYENAKKSLNENPIEKKWQKIMSKFKEGPETIYKEVYRMP